MVGGWQPRGSSVRAWLKGSCAEPSKYWSLKANAIRTIISLWTPIASSLSARAAEQETPPHLWGVDSWHLRVTSVCRRSSVGSEVLIGTQLFVENYFLSRLPATSWDCHIHLLSDAWTIMLAKLAHWGGILRSFSQLLMFFWIFSIKNVYRFEDIYF